MVRLGVNIDHVATVRQARRTVEPLPVLAALEAEEAGCDSIVCHLRKDRRHIQDRDLREIKEKISIKFNMEMSIDPEIVEIACGIKPNQATLVPENRQEITTEGGLDVAGAFKKVKEVVNKLMSNGIEVSLFIDPEKDQIEASRETGVNIIELHTGRYAEACILGEKYKEELKILEEMAKLSMKSGLVLCAGHGLTYKNVVPVARMKGMHELNIGHSIISRAIFSGICNAVREMKELIN